MGGKNQFGTMVHVITPLETYNQLQSASCVSFSLLLETNPTDYKPQKLKLAKRTSYALDNTESSVTQKFV